MGKRRREYLLSLALASQVGFCVVCKADGKLEDHVHPEIESGDIYLETT